ncbi:MAG: two-component system response regulator [Treponema sp. GWB1_62_6]|nr:MAG: two-component system response regulator [Treponema sp. GWC1_61_84]OHE66672.1 MAG: two-component system response regulator [Treponema sp. GWA1_62_8]OHE68042.1 MAG: two-component system response regulator [Treponema sp. GWB1_62_6]OHE68933.1 MAG: two-component system response regulator [Treponema sp. RIFOXYC1_FULL_61_9]HCM27385.1 two-component system response regulator [Treponema sp.]
MNGYNQIDILLVEDNPNDAELAIRALRKYNLANNLVHVSDGEEALDFIFARGKFADRNIADRPKMVLLDLKLPKIDGMEVLKAVKSDPRTALIPVVVLTTSKEESDVIMSYSLGANSFIVKPVDFDKFIEAVRELGYYWLLLNEHP